MHSIMMLETSRVRANPPSSIMEPACMKNTRKAVTSTHAVLRPFTTSVTFTAAACPGTAAPASLLKNQAKP